MFYRFNNVDYRDLPQRIRLTDGTTRTSLHQLSEAELSALGIEVVQGDFPEPPPAPVVPGPLTHKQFMDRFTDTELAGIIAAAKTNADVELWLKKFELSQDIVLSDPLTVDGVEALEAVGLLAQGRAATILA